MSSVDMEYTNITILIINVMKNLKVSFKMDVSMALLNKPEAMVNKS